MVIDPRFVHVDWNLEGDAHGKAAYRSLGEGRWVVDVTGDGSLGLRRRAPGEEVRLEPPPPVRRYEPVHNEVDRTLGAIRPGEALEALARELAPGT
jgi:hypothetical protein